MDEYKKIERSIIVRFRKEIYRKFMRAIQNYKLIEENDSIAVCISGGKDSFLLAKCMEEVQKHGKVKFDLKYICMDPGYNDKNRELILSNAKKMNINLNIFNTNIFDSVVNIDKNPCYLCARMRRGYLYSYAKDLGCNKIALGHHFDDVIETTLLSIIYGGEVNGMMPKLHSDNFKGLELIRPLYLVREKDIKDWVKYNNLTFLNCACHFTEKACNDINSSKRLKIKNLIHDLELDDKFIVNNIFKSMDNVNIDTVRCYKINDKRYNFMDKYDIIDKE